MPIRTSLALLLVLDAVAAAEGEPPAPPSAEMPRRFTLAATVGAAALPSTDLSVAVAEAGVNFASSERIDYRLSAVVYGATGDNDSSGYGLAFEQRWNLGASYAAGIGVMLANHTIEHSDEDEDTAMIGILATPAVFRLGENRAWEIGLTAFAMREFAYDTVTPGFYLSAGYCAR